MQEEHLRLENLSLKAQNRQLMTRALRSAPSPPPSATPPRVASPESVPMDSVCLLNPHRAVNGPEAQLRDTHATHAMLVCQRLATNAATPAWASGWWSKLICCMGPCKALRQLHP